MSFQSSFIPKIWERGKTYASIGAVYDLQVEDAGNGSVFIEAQVEGTYDYSVELAVADGEIHEAYCSCPFSQDVGELCKHMAAVLMVYEKSKAEPLKNSPSLEEVDAAIFKEFCLAKAGNKPAFKRELQTYITDRTEKVSLDKLKKRVSSIISKYAGYSGYIYYEKMDDFEDELSFFLDQQRENLLHGLTVQEHFDFADDLLAQLDDTGMDDSDGGLMRLTEQVFESLEARIVQGQDEEVFAQLLAGLSQKRNSPLTDYYWNLFEEHFSSQDFAERKLAFLLEYLELPPENASWSESYAFKYEVELIFSISKKLGKSLTDLRQLLQGYWSQAEVRQVYTDELIAQGFYSKAEKLIKEDLSAPESANHGRLRLKLKDLYRQQEKWEDYCQLLEEILLTGTIDFGLIDELKKQLKPADWQTVRLRLKESWEQRNAWGLIEFYRREGFWEEVLVRAQSNPVVLEQSYLDLGQHFPQETLDLLSAKLEDSLRHPCTRKRYKEFAEILADMKEMAGGEAVVQQLLSRWRTAYRNRPAMLEEFSRL